MIRFVTLLAAASVLAFTGPGVGAEPDRHQVQPRRRARHAEGQGRREVQGACREVHQRQGQGRGLSELAALQGQGRARGAAARRRADAGAVELPSSARSASRNSRCSTCPIMLPTKASLRKVTEGPIGKQMLKQLEPKGMVGLAYWDNGFKRDERQQAAAHAGGLQGPEVPHPVLEGARGAVPRARRHPAGDGVLRSLPGAADRRRRRPGEHAVEHVHPENARGAEVHRRSPTTATSATSWS